jgi:hypothetical protein
MAHAEMLDQVIDELSQATTSDGAAKAFGRLMEQSLKQSLTERDIVDRMVAALEKPTSSSQSGIWELFRYLDMHSWEYLGADKQAFVYELSS